MQIRSALVMAMLLGSAALAQTTKPSAKPTTQPIKTLRQMLAPTLISLQCKAASSEAAAALLEKQVGFSLEARTPEDRADDQGKINCNHTNQPYWAVIRDVCVQGDLRVSTLQAKRAAPFALALRREATRDFMYFPPKADSALVPTVTDIGFRRNFGGETDRTRVSVRVTMLAEPKVFVAGYKRQPTIDLAVDDTGASLMLSPEEQRFSGFGGGGFGGRRGRFGGGGFGGQPPETERGPAAEYASVPRHNQFPVFGVNIKTPAKTIKRLKGSATLVFGFDPMNQDVSGLLGGGEERIKLGRLGAIVLSGYTPGPADQRTVSFSVTLPRVKLANGNHTDETLEFRSMRFIMTDGQGNSFGYTGLHDQNVNFTAGEVTYTARFEWPWGDEGQFESKPTKVTCILPTRLEEATVPFEFFDVPMPVAEKPATQPAK